MKDDDQSTVSHSSATSLNNRLSCRTDMGRCFVSLDILLSYSMSFEMTPLSRVYAGN